MAPYLGEGEILNDWWKCDVIGQLKIATSAIRYIGEPGYQDGILVTDMSPDAIHSLVITDGFIT